MGASFVLIRHALYPSRAVKGQTLAEFLAAHPISENSKLHEDIPDEVFESNITSEDEVWQMFFDGASRIGPKGRIIAGVGVVFISPTESCPS